MTIHRDQQPNELDLELLSAYIDSRLSDAERAKLDRRLDQDPALRRTLDELRATVGLLRGLEPARPPRSFTLDPSVAAPRRGWSFPWMQFGSAIVAATLLVVFGFAFMQSQSSNLTSAPIAASAPSAAPAAAEQAPAAAKQNSDAGVTAAPAAAAPMAAAAATSAPAADTSDQATPEVALSAAPTDVARMAEAQAAPTIAAAAGGAALNPYDSSAATGAVPQANPLATPAAPGAESAQIATSGSSSPGTTTLEQPTALPAPVPGARAPGGAWLALGALALILAIGAWLRLRRR